MASDTVRVGVLDDWPPHYLLGPDGLPAGFAVDMMEAVARRTGLVARYELFGTFPDVIGALEAGEIDVIPDFGVTSERQETVAFTRPFGAFRISVFARRSDPELQQVDDVSDRRIGVVQSNAAIALLGDAYPGAALVTYPDVREALFELLAVGVDAVAFPEEVFIALARAAGVEDRLHILDPPLAEIPRAMGVRSANILLRDRLDGGLEDLVGSDEHGGIYRRWFGQAPSFWTVERVVWGATAILLVVLLGMGAWRYRSVSALARDLSRGLAERDRAERAHAETHRLLRRTLECLDGAVFVIEPGGGSIIECNAAAEAVFGYTRDHLLGSDTRLLHVDDDHYRELEAVGESVLAEGETYEGEFVMRRADGGTFPTRNTIAPLHPERGLEGGLVSIVYDVTEQTSAQRNLRESEERFRQIAERISDVFWITSPGKDHMEYVSPGYEEIWGLPASELRRRANAWLDSIHPDDRDRVEAALPGQALGEYDLEYRIVRPDGEIRWISDRAFPVHDVDGRVTRVVGVARDVTERRMAEDEREALERQLRQAQRLEAVGRLAGGVAHDFNNLLTVIRSQTDLVLLDLPKPSPMADELEVIQSAADRAAKVTNQLLAFSRDQVLRPRVVDLGEVVRDIAVLLERIIGEDVEMKLEIGESPLSVLVDPGQLEQVVMNLGVNARDAMPEGGRLVLKTYGYEVPPEGSESTGDLVAGPHVVLEVSDTGIGMDDETGRRIFDPFFTTKVRGTGTGLGLAMVYGFVKQSGGHVRVESDPGVGTTFFLYFPTAAVPERVMEDAPVRPAPTGETGHIVLVEDDGSVRRVTSRILEYAGFEVDAFEDAESALEALEAAHPADLVLTDLGLPGMGGRTLLDRIRVLRPGVPLIAMSGYAVGPSGGVAELPPDVLFIQKPFTSEDLIERVRTALGDG